MQRVKASPETVHWGYFDCTLPPVATVRPGERVRIETVSGGADVTPGTGFTVLPEHREIQRTVTRRMLPGHILTGPVAVEGAPVELGGRAAHRVRLVAAHASAPDDGDSLESLVERLDDRLVDAAAAGRIVLPFPSGRPAISAG